MESTVRVRYAPSPTGMQHIGGVRTALFNYFFARSQGGSFILRIEDTDQTRFNPESLQDIYDTFAWLGIEPDEGPSYDGEYGPYVQSERAALYREYCDRLVATGHAYLDYFSRERLGAGGESRPYEYEGRSLPAEEIERLEAEGVDPVVRLLVPLEGKTEFEDLVLGRIRRKNKDIPADPILMKSDGYPTYHLANVVDDHLMGITHVLRAQEWVPSTPIHLLLYSAFGWEPPTFCHLPMVMGKDGQKLSKRHGSTSLVEFRRAGYLPEAITNYISLLGWSYDDSREFFTRTELEELFDPAKLNKAPAVFDYKKLDWFNGRYIRRLADEEIVELVMPYLRNEGWVSDPVSEDERLYVHSLIPIIRERLKVLGDVVPLTRFLFTEVEYGDGSVLVPKKSTAVEAREWLLLGRSVLEELGLGGDETLEERFREEAERLEVKLGNLLMVLRVAVTGSTVSPPLFPSARFLGMEETMKRIEQALMVLETMEECR